MFRVLGFDPGLSASGWGAIESASGALRLLECGELRTNNADRLESRLARIYDEALAWIRRLAPDSLAVEQQIQVKNVRTAMTLGQVQGAAMLAAAHAGIPAFAYTPLDIKKAVSGSGRAEKRQVARMAAVLLGCRDRPLREHEGDALAVAICHLHARKLERLLKASRREA